MVKVFVSYAHEDVRYLERLLVHLANLRRQRVVEVWSDQEIEAGARWKTEIWDHFNAAQIIVLLVSADFINSDFAFCEEFQTAVKRYRAGQVALLPVIVRPCHRKGNVIETLQCLFNDTPVSAYEHEDPDGPWIKVVEAIETKARRIESMTTSGAARTAARNEGDELRYLC